MSDHAHVRHDLGAYVLGALEPAERHAVEAHVAECATCRDALAHLSGMPALLDRLSPEEATADLAAAGAGTVARLRGLTAAEHGRLRRRVRRWQAVAVAAGLVAATLGVRTWTPGRAPRPAPVVAVVVPLAGDAAAVRGTVEAYAWEWGSTIELDVADLPPRSAYVVWAVADDGTRERAGTWGPTASAAATVRGASAIQRPRLATVEVTGPDGQPVFAARFDATDGGETG